MSIKEGLLYRAVELKSAIMSFSVDCLRTFIIERLTVAAEEIFAAFQQKIDGYEDEVNYQRRLVESVWRPQIKLHRLGMYNFLVFKRLLMSLGLD